MGECRIAMSDENRILFGMSISLPSPLDRLNWYALHVRPGRETYVRDRLDERDVDVFCPMQPVSKRPSRHVRAKRAKVQQPRPLLVGYCVVGFAQPPQTWRDVMELPNVTGVVGMRQGRAPLRIPYSALKPLMDLDRDPGTSEALRVGFEVGDMVSVLDGPFQGFAAEVVRIRKEHARILLGLLGGALNVDIPVDSLEKQT
jgi:transcriptional antiterminator NusG